MKNIIPIMLLVFVAGCSIEDYKSDLKSLRNTNSLISRLSKVSKLKLDAKELQIEKYDEFWSGFLGDGHLSADISISSDLMAALLKQKSISSYHKLPLPSSYSSDIALDLESYSKHKGYYKLDIQGNGTYDLIIFSTNLKKLIFEFSAM